MNFRKMKLAAKISIAIGIVMIISLTILIGSSVILAEKAVTQAIDGEFSGIANQNGLIVANILDTAQSSAVNLQDYIENSYKKQATMSAEQAATYVPEQSMVTGTIMPGINIEVENYVANTAWATVKNSEYITAMGVCFAPY